MRSIQSVTVRMSTTRGEGKHGGSGSTSTSNGNGNNDAFRTAPFYMKAPYRGACSPQWYEGHRRLRVTEGTTKLRAKVLARVDRGGVAGRERGKGDKSNTQRQQQQHAPPAEGLISTSREMAGLAANEIVLAFASVDLDAVRDGFNYIPLFSPDSPEDDDGGSGGGSKRPEGEKRGRARASIAEKNRFRTALKGIFSGLQTDLAWLTRKAKEGEITP